MSEMKFVLCSLKRRYCKVTAAAGRGFIHFFYLQKNIMLLKKICPVGIVFIIKENWRGISTLHSLAQF
jgi:hypothetical protein